MKKKSLWVLVTILTSLYSSGQNPEDKILQEAKKIHQRAIVVDCHSHELLPGTEKTKIDLLNMKEGGVDVICFSLPYRREEIKDLEKRVREDIRLIQAEMSRHPGRAKTAHSSEDIKRHAAEGMGSVLFSLEHFFGMFDNNTDTIESLYEAGVRSITLVNNEHDPIGIPRDRELTDFGKSVVQAMNRLGMLIDITHLGENLQRQIIETSKAPVIASHSNARSVVNTPRNLSDEIIKKIADRGGAVMLGFSTSYLTGENPLKSGMEYLMDHIDHIVKITGVDHVGIGTDGQAAGQYFPEDLRGPSCFPRITYSLLKRGYTEEDIRKIMGGNFLRILSSIEN